MKKIDILNFITDFRKAPNQVKTHQEVLNHLGPVNATAINQMLMELQQSKVIRETDVKGEKGYQVISR